MEAGAGESESGSVPRNRAVTFKGGACQISTTTLREHLYTGTLPYLLCTLFTYTIILLPTWLPNLEAHNERPYTQGYSTTLLLTSEPQASSPTMTSPKLPPIADIMALPTKDRAAILDLLFEPSTQLHTLSVPLLHEKQFESYADLISAVGVQLTDLAESASSSDTEWLESILGSHPRLGAKKVESAQSQAEQAQLQGTADETEQLLALNGEYERKYPGLRYVVFVNGRNRSVIMDDMRQRIANSDLESERLAAIKVSICTQG